MSLLGDAGAGVRPDAADGGGAVGGGVQGGAGGGGVEGRLGKKDKSSIDIFSVVDGMLFLSVQ